MVLAVSAWQCTCAMLLLACLSSFAWGMQRFFIQPVGATTGMRITKICGLLFSILHLSLILTQPAIEIGQALLATILYSLSLFLFWWAVYTNRARPLSAVFSPDPPMHFVCQGPYQWVRHPFYTSYLLTWMAGVIATTELWLLITVMVMTTLYWKAARLEEQKFFQSTLASLYAAYRSRTGLFAPKLIGVWLYVRGTSLME